METLKWLEEWFESNCDGDWEHGSGVRIATLDNPGWTIDIDLVGTRLENVDFLPIEVGRTDNDWIYCNVKENIFKAYGGPKNLKEMLEIFKNWATNM